MVDTTKPELEKELADIRREVIESRNLVIKTDNTLKNIHAEVKEVGRRQKEFQTKQLISSAAAYVLFTLVAAGAAIWATTAATSGANAERGRLEKSVSELSSQVDGMKATEGAELTSRKAANEVYRMMTELPGEARLKGIDAFAKLDTSHLSPLEKQALADRTTTLRRELGQAAFERGKAAYRRGDMPGTVEELNRFMTMGPSDAEQLDASFYLGAALSQLRKHELAIPYLARFVANDRRSKTRDYGMLLLATSYEQAGQPDRAVEVTRDAIGTYPNSEFVPQLRIRLSSAKRQAAGNGAATANSATGGSPPSPAPAAASPGTKASANAGLVAPPVAAKPVQPNKPSAPAAGTSAPR